MKAQYILDNARQRIIDEVMIRPVFARVVWDFDHDAWAIECEACHKGPTVATRAAYPELTDGQIRDALLASAERHNRTQHG